MYEGKIIRFYREKYQMTQEQLGKGICSGTHISKIERLQTEYAPEIITLLAERLGINIEDEILKLKNIKKRLDQWQDVIIKELFEEMNLIHNELLQVELIQISNYINLYQLLRVRYLLMHHSVDEAYQIITEMQKNESKLSTYEANLLKHVLGIYYLAKHENLKAIQFLKSIQETEYNNKEYFYHLAVAYHSHELPVMSYFYAEKALQFFKENKSYLRTIDTEMLMLIQVKDDGSFNETIKGFENLIQSCDLCSSPERKARVCHNLAYEYFRRKKYDLASRYYYQSMTIKDHESSKYLLSLEGYIRSSFNGNLLSQNELLHLVKQGLETAVKNNELLYIHLFNLQILLIENKEHDYHQYLKNEALPMFKQFGFMYLIKRSNQELFNYYTKMNQTNEALTIAQLLINS